MQGLADGYFVLPYTIGKYLSKNIKMNPIKTDHESFIIAEDNVKERNKRLLQNNGNKSVESFHRDLGKIVWDYCGMSRNEPNLISAIDKIKDLREDFWKYVKVLGDEKTYNPDLDKAGRVADFFELGELMMRDALERNESCGGHFREEFQTKEGEALRDDKRFTFASTWEFKGVDRPPVLHKENLDFETVKPTQRSYK